MTKFYYTAIKHRRLFAFIAVFIMAFAMFIPTTVEVFAIAPAVIALIPVFKALCAAVGISLVGVAAEQLPNTVKDFMFRAPQALSTWMAATAGALAIDTLNKHNITPTVLKEFCATIKGSVISGINGVAEDIGYKFDTTTATNAAGESNPMVPTFSDTNYCIFQNSTTSFSGYIKNYCKDPVVSNVFYATKTLDSLGNVIVTYNFPRTPLFKIKATGEIYFIDNMKYSDNAVGGEMFVFIVDKSGAKVLPPENSVQCINYCNNNIGANSYLGPLYDASFIPTNVSSPIAFLMTGLSTSGLPLVSLFGGYDNTEKMTFAFNPELVDVLVGDFTVPVDKFGDTAIASGVDTAIDNVSDFADAQALEGVLDIPINIPLDAVGEFVIPIDPSEIIDISTPDPDPKPDPKPDPDPPPDPPNPPSKLPDMEVPNVILDKFPFCIPFDLVKSFKLLSSPAVMPEFDIPFKFPAYNINYTIHLDFKQFEKPIRIWKWFCSFLFVVGLIFLTRKIIGA